MFIQRRRRRLVNKWLYISLLITNFCFGQEIGQDSLKLTPHSSKDISKYLQILPLVNQFQDLHYRSQIANSQHNFKRDINVHDAVKPMLIWTPYQGKSKLSYSKMSGQKYQYFHIYPLTDLMGGIELGADLMSDFNAGAGVGMDYASKKFVITAKGLPYYTNSGFYRDSIQSTLDIDAGTNRSLASSIFYRAELMAAFKANKFFTFMGGYGKNFFGSGYRSILLSDNAGAHPFFKIETSFAGIKYVNLYNIWRDNTTDPFNRSVDIPKFSSVHYLSWNITKDLNFSVFEAVVFQSKDTITNRGFDFNYLNPIVFYRPVEYGLGSADNVLMGLNISYKLDDNNQIYSQFLIDEFLLREIRARSRWWANKYAWQIGYRSNAFFNDSLYFQFEFNGARPFTYSHKFSQHAYGHMNASVTHPLGANYMELLNIVSYKSNRHRFTNKLTFSAYGVDDSASVSNGQDIFKSYSLRPGEYDQFLYQGIRTNVLNETFIYEYEILPKINMFLTARYNWRMANTSLGTDHFHTFQVGIKSRIWNSYTDF